MKLMWKKGHKKLFSLRIYLSSDGEMCENLEMIQILLFSFFNVLANSLFLFSNVLFLFGARKRPIINQPSNSQLCCIGCRLHISIPSEERSQHGRRVDCILKRIETYIS